MEKIVMVLKVEKGSIEVTDRNGNKKNIDKVTLRVTDGMDEFLCEAVDETATNAIKENVEGKLCSLNCRMFVREWESNGKKGVSTNIRVVSIQSMFELHNKYLDHVKEKTE